MINSVENMTLYNKPSIEILEDFLQLNHIDTDARMYLRKYLLHNFNNANLTSLPCNIIDNVIVDSFDGWANQVKKITSIIYEKYSIRCGRTQKNQLKKFLDYGNQDDLNIFMKMLNCDLSTKDKIENICVSLRSEHELINNSYKEIYLNNLKRAIEGKKNRRIKDYLLFIYSRLLGINERRFVSLNDIFTENTNEIKKVLSHKSYLEFKSFCDESRGDRKDIVYRYINKYTDLLDKDGEYAIVFLNIDQKLFNSYDDKNNFFGALCSFIKKAYTKIQNHKSLILKINDVFLNGINLKWEIYSVVCIFAEKFLKVSEDRPYYFPEEMLKDFLEYSFSSNVNDKELLLLKKYYKNKITYDELKVTDISIKDKELIDDFKNIYTGFTFQDCLILRRNETENSRGLDFISNIYDIVLVFMKNKIDERKIPCPVCGSLKISGNSYPEIGIKSWECKNPLCFERSKTNRGKRYSYKSIIMNNALFDFNKENIISPEITYKWRKDVIENWSSYDFYKMMIKYFSFVNDKIAIINITDFEEFLTISQKEKRFAEPFDFKGFTGIVDVSSYETFFQSNNRTFLNNFLTLSSKKNIGFNGKIRNLYTKEPSVKIVKGNCRDVLYSMDEGSVDNMVTSPPYYNAREYSKWKNIFQYLNDMYNIVNAASKALREGRYFLFNIGDIFDNENIVVKSLMGEKRIPLGAYIILLFQKCGFDILDNIIWFKGEPQSNRHKNDGNFTPYYQRPANAYEHIFIFRKKDKDFSSFKSKNDKIDNIQKFTPVIKIGREGKNRHGHSAPFPSKIPIISTQWFTKPDEIVLDPFAGSGTSPLAAAINNRIGIGIEINDDYINLTIEKCHSKNLKFECFNCTPNIPKISLSMDNFLG